MTNMLVTLHASVSDYLLHSGMSVAPSSETLSYVLVSKFSKFGSLVTLHASGSDFSCYTVGMFKWHHHLKLCHMC